MNRLFVILSVLIMSCSSMLADPVDTLVVRIKGMRCEECAHKVNKLLRQKGGIENIDFNIERRTATIAFNPQVTSVDSIKASLAATVRYKTSEYNPSEVIRKGIGLQMSDMHCQKCADRIMTRLQQMEGIDSMSPHLDKHYMFIRYDANRTCRDEIVKVLSQLGFTPVTYYTSKVISYAYFNIPSDKANEETIETAMGLEGVDDANVSPRNKSLAITYVNNETTEDKLLEELKAEGIEAVVPAPHECKEEK